MSRIRLRHLLLIPLLLGALAAALLTAGMLSLQPTVPHGGALDDSDVRQIEQLIADNSPARLDTRGARDLSLSADELTLLSAFMFAQVPQLQEFAIEFELEDSHGQAWLSIPASLGSLTFYLNLHADFAQEAGKARLQRVRAGQIPVPRRVLRWMEDLAGQRVESSGATHQELAELRHQLSDTSLNDSMLHMRLSWEPEVLAQLRSQAQQIFLTPEDRERILVYYTTLADLTQQHAGERRSVSIQALLPALFDVAQQRSKHGSAIAENRSLLQVVSLYVNNLHLDQLLTPVPDVTPPSSLRVTLYQRQDLTRHFITSAAIAASAGAGIAEVLANSKEVYDARHSTGFSFSDMTANVAGLMLGETATQDEESARRMQSLLKFADAESVYMPEPSTVNDGLSETDFIEIFEDRSSVQYQQRIDEIQARVTALPIYTHLSTE